MIENLPFWVELLFLATFIIVIVFFHYANGKSKILTSLVILWTVLHSVLAYYGFYENDQSVPPRYALVLLPILFFIIYSLLPKQRNWILQNRDTGISTFSHVIRVPVEIILFQLFIHKMIPELMTFEGRNFDIIAGITAPIIGFMYLKEKLSNRGLLMWNIAGLFLVCFIYINGILSAELSFQQFGFEQPNRAVMYFPFVILPATIVPIVIWTHLIDIIQLSKKIKTE